MQNSISVFSIIFFLSILSACTTSDLGLFSKTLIEGTLEMDEERTKNKYANLNLSPNHNTRHVKANDSSLNSNDVINGVIGSIGVVSVEKFKVYRENEKLKFPEIENVHDENEKPITTQILNKANGPAIDKDLITINENFVLNDLGDNSSK